MIMVMAMVAAGSVSCGGSQGDGASSGSANVSAVASGETDGDACLAAINTFIVDTLSAHYDKAEVCIPFPIIVDRDESDKDDVKVWGIFWIENYNVAGDTLKNVSGGSYPGLMHLKATDKGFTVKGFDVVADGSDFEPSARKIFGDRYEKFQKQNSDNKQRAEQRTRNIAEYVKAHGLKVKMYQDYGWPAVSLPDSE